MIPRFYKARHGPDSAWPVLDAGHNLRYFLPWDYWGGMQLKAKRIVVALSSTLFAVSVVAHPASGDSSKDRACAKIRQIDDHASGASGEKRTLRDAIAVLQTSSSSGTARIVQNLRAAQSGDTVRRRAAVREALLWCGSSQAATTPILDVEFSPQHYEGTHSAVVPLQLESNQVAVARIVTNDRAEITVRALAATGSPLATLVSTTGPYSGVRPVNLEVGNDPKQLDVEHEGAWAIDIAPLSNAPRISVAEQYDGVGDAVLVVDHTAREAKFGTSVSPDRFRVLAYGTVRVQLIDESTPFTGSVILPKEAGLVLVVQSTVTWSVMVI